MSLTSYRTAPPRGFRRGSGVRRRRYAGSWVLSLWAGEGGSALGGPGGDLLSRALRRSTIGAEGFHGRVRDGLGCWSPRHSRQAVRAQEAEISGPGWELRVAPWSIGVSRGLGLRFVAARDGVGVKPVERLGPVSFTRCRASTSGLSTWWSTTALQRDLVLRGGSRLDAFSGYPVRT